MKARIRICSWLMLVSVALPALGNTNVSEIKLPLYLVGAVTYEPGRSVEPFRSLDALVQKGHSDGSLRKLMEIQLGKMLSPIAATEARYFAAAELAVIGGDHALPDIERLLRNEETVALACFALSTYPPGKADAVLRDALAVARGVSRIQIINTLGGRRDADSVDALAELARGLESDAAEAAIVALAKIGNDDAREVLGSLFKGDAELDRAITAATLRVADQLAEARDRDAIPMFEKLLAASNPVYLRRAALAGLLKADEKTAEQRIIEIIRGSDEALKPVAIAAVRNVRAKTASENLGLELANLPPEQQIWLIDSLAERGDSPARAAISARLTGSPDGSVRKAAALALGRIGHPAFARPLGTALATAKDPEEANIIESALAMLPDKPETDDAVLAELQIAKGEVRAHVISSMMARRSPKVIAALFDEASNPEPAPCKAAFRVLAKGIRPDNLAQLLTKFTRIEDPKLLEELEIHIEQATLNVDDLTARSEAVREVLARTFQTNPRASLVRLLPSCGDAFSLSMLTKAIDEPEPKVRDSAVAALAEWPELKAWDTLINVYLKPRSERYREIALRGLVRLQGEHNATFDNAHAERYRKLFASVRGYPDLKRILGALGGAAHPDALNLAVPYLSNPPVREEAAAAIKRIAEAIKDKHPDAASAALAKLTATPRPAPRKL